MSNRSSESSPQKISRRTFLKGAVALAATGGVSAALFEQLSGSGKSHRRHELFAATPSWEQDFSRMADGQPDPRYWSFVTGNKIAGYNNEAQTYTSSPENVRIENGALIIEAKKEDKNDRHYTSGRIFTEGKFGFEYGKLEVDLKVPKGVGTWPAAWLLPSKPRYNPGDYGINDPDNGWLINGEIDFFEAYGTNPNIVYPSAHTWDSQAADNAGINPPNIHIPNNTQGFHRIGVEKLPGSIIFTADGKPYHREDKKSDSPKEWPFEQSYYLILNLAMGVPWEKEAIAQFPPKGIDDSQDPWKMEISSIKYWPLAA